MFSGQLYPDQHSLSSALNCSNRSTSMENMKHLFAVKSMHSSRFLTKPGCSNPFTTNEKGVTPTRTLMLLKKKVGQSPNGKNSVIQKNVKAF